MTEQQLISSVKSTFSFKNL